MIVFKDKNPNFRALRNEIYAFNLVAPKTHLSKIFKICEWNLRQLALSTMQNFNTGQLYQGAVRERLLDKSTHFPSSSHSKKWHPEMLFETKFR